MSPQKAAAALAGKVLRECAGALERRDILLLCCAEDVETLVTPFIAALVEMGVSNERIYLHCYWRHKVVVAPGIEVWPIRSQFTETCDAQSPACILLSRSIAASGEIAGMLVRALDDRIKVNLVIATTAFTEVAQRQIAMDFSSRKPEFHAPTLEQLVWVFAPDAPQAPLPSPPADAVFSAMGPGLGVALVKQRRAARFGR